MISVIASLDLGIYGYFSATDSAGSQYRLIFYSLDCLILKSGRAVEDIPKIKVLIVLFSPAAKLLIVAAVILVMKLINYLRRKNKEGVFRRYMLLVAVGLLLSEQPNIVGTLADYLSCESLDTFSENRWLQSNRSVMCYTDNYNYFRNVAVVPGMVFFVVLLPLIFFLVLLRFRASLQQSKTIILGIGTLYRDYTIRRFYWGLIIILLKSLIYIINSVFTFNSTLQGLTLMGVFVGYLLFLKRRDPYRQEGIQKVEIVTMKIYIWVIFLVLYMLKTSIWVQVICLIGIAVLVCGMILYLAYKILPPYLSILQNIIEEVKIFVEKWRMNRNKSKGQSEPLPTENIKVEALSQNGESSPNDGTPSRVSFLNNLAM